MKFKTRQASFNSTIYFESLKIRRQVFVLEQKINEELEIEFENDCDYFLTYVNGIPASTGRLRIKGDMIKFERIATLKEFRGKGTGSALMETMFNFAKKNYPHLTPYMHSQDSAVSFYEKLGWVKVGAPFVEADIPHQAMKKE